MSDKSVSPRLNLDLLWLTVPAAGATAYRPLPVEPETARASATPEPKPPPSPPAPPAEPAYPSLPTEPDTRDGGGGETK